MPNFIDMTGRKCGELTVVRRADGPKDRTYWHCICSCGTEKKAWGQNLRDGRTTSCGCKQKEGARRRLLKHGRSDRTKEDFVGYSRETHVLRKYGITNDQYLSLLKDQGSACFVCGYKFGQKNGDTYVDHCHTTGIVRGLLCMNCNAGIGHFLDDIDRLKTAIQYLSDTTRFVTPKFPIKKYANAR